ncbi:ATP-dependent Clp protease proteolytic subunit [Plasmodium gonderi]|uniref:ATP-dependent Clp protease proteolytic subunit n=1 Tax=Plasmodium gonderi TaxID=77519 RepID=A0A1Y1JHC6_PLAGO|nr:ATP-dependent Clp protease proteolytic subunit [Plasmodium gonderi]GAW80745.1 ATP-dependent Clp protease proteolytic subunit [Plasmodium gonderi]
MTCLFLFLFFILLKNTNKTHAKKIVKRLNIIPFIHFPNGRVAKRKLNFILQKNAHITLVSARRETGTYSGCCIKWRSPNSLPHLLLDKQENVTNDEEIDYDKISRSEMSGKGIKNVKNCEGLINSFKDLDDNPDGAVHFTSMTSPHEVLTTLEETHKRIEKKKKKKNYKRKEEKLISGVDHIKDIKKDVKLFFFKKRIIYLTEEINKKTADELISQLLYLDNLNHDDIKIYINSPGGSINEGLAILDIFNYIKSDIQTISFGLVASMASVILASGKMGKRKSLPNCRIMIHQPLGNAFGHPHDIEIQTKEILYLKKLLYNYLASFTRQTVETIEKDSDRDYYMNAFEAKKYGIIDEVIETKLPHPYFCEVSNE